MVQASPGLSVLASLVQQAPTGKQILVFSYASNGNAPLMAPVQMTIKPDSRRTRETFTSISDEYFDQGGAIVIAAIRFDATSKAAHAVMVVYDERGIPVQLKTMVKHIQVSKDHAYLVASPVPEATLAFISSQLTAPSCKLFKGKHRVVNFLVDIVV